MPLQNYLHYAKMAWFFITIIRNYCNDFIVPSGIYNLGQRTNNLRLDRDTGQCANKRVFG